MSNETRAEADAAACKAETKDMKATATALEQASAANGKLNPEQQQAVATAHKFTSEQEADMRKSGVTANNEMVAALSETNAALAAALKNGNFAPDKAIASGLKYMAEEVRGGADYVDQSCIRSKETQRLREDRSGGRS
jgi:hypothetical protein